ncbi:MAG: gamma-glutamyltransferase [Pseudomonadota bacterium]
MSVVPATVGYQHVVAAGHELAAQAAFEVLEAGGNAVDAGVAAVLSLGVLYSDQVSIAGVAPMLIYSAETRQLITIDGLGGWPASLDVDDFIARHNGTIPLGVRRTVIPAAPAAVIKALELFGTMRFADVAERAAQYAERGFARHPVMLEYVAQYADCYREFPDNVDIWLPGGEVPPPGSLLVQPDLGRTLRYLIDEDRAAGRREAGLAAVRSAFYAGDLASAILRHQREHDGMLSESDLQRFDVRLLPTEQRTLHFGGRDVVVHSCGAWSQGPIMLEALSMLQHLNLEAMEYGSSAYFHTVAEVLKLALADREGYLGDPDFVPVPVTDLISASYGYQRSRAVDPRRATPGMPAPGAIEGYAPYLAPEVVRTAPERLPADTSIVTVIDQRGNAICITPSDTSWDTPVVPGTGLAISSRGQQSWAVKGHPSCLAPGKRPRLTPNPCFAQVPGEWIMPFGTPGGDQQVQANVQMLLSHLQFGMPLQDAIEAPRLITHSQPDSFAPHACTPGRVTIEGRVDAAVVAGMAERGHQMEHLADWTHAVAGLCAVRKDLRTGQMVGGADPRRMSRAIGW